MQESFLLLSTAVSVLSSDGSTTPEGGADSPAPDGAGLSPAVARFGWEEVCNVLPIVGGRLVLLGLFLGRENLQQKAALSIS